MRTSFLSPVALAGVWPGKRGRPSTSSSGGRCEARFDPGLPRAHRTSNPGAADVPR